MRMNVNDILWRLLLLVLVGGQMALGADPTPNAQPQTPNLKWAKADHSIALTNNEKIVWQFNYAPKQSKPYFHPVSLSDGTVLTENSPKDHPWHHALWFSWKKINGVNFWEEDQKGQCDGKTSWENVKVVTNKDYSAVITMDLNYNHRGQKPIVSEKLKIKVSPPNKDGLYTMDWSSKFKACSKAEVLFDRTPPTGEPDGQAWGGYAGLSVRLNGKGKDWTVETEKGPVKCDKETYRGKAKCMDFSGVIDGQPAGIAILDHPKNLNAPTPWYASAGNPMKYFSPAVICDKPYTLPAGKSFTLRYKVIIHPKKWDAGILKILTDPKKNK
ncbi:MAG: PmoA family protein [Phycisphaerae bacterium]|nr:PmoA family protein [Phycisphaerae bacterium]